MARFTDFSKLLRRGFPRPARPAVRSFAVALLLPVILELLLHLFIFGMPTARIVYPVMFALAVGCLLFGGCTLFPAKVSRILTIVAASFVTLYFEVQFVYCSIFGEFMSLWQVSFGATAIANFWKQMLYGIWQALLPILALLVPLAGLCVLIRLDKRAFTRPGYGWCAVLLACAVALHFGTVEVMKRHDDGAFSVYRLYCSSETATNISVNNIGLLPTARLEGKYLLFGAPESAHGYVTEGEQTEIDDSARYNMLNIDFAALRDATDTDTLKKLDDFFAAQQPTEKNEYTGAFKDCNLIMLCCESYSPLLIDPVRTPALYELSTHGFVFNNYYGSYGSNTTNGEYTFCTGLYPDLSRSKSTASFYASQKSYLPFCMGNLFKDQGVQTWAYHNYTGAYYSRNVTHPNMGYTFKAADEGLDMKLLWPTSDLEMMEKSVDDYLANDERFCAYYMTFSGHYQYNWDNPMCAKNRSAVESLPYSDPVKAYISCNLELEYALEYLMQRLEEAGAAEDTVIVLTNDHYPYGLSADQYNELAGREIDTEFEKYRSSFICYRPGMAVPVDTYCSTIDILPTLLNLFGLPYDSRLLMGRDVLSPQADNMAVLSDQSFITPDFSFSTSNGKVVKFTDQYSDELLTELQTRIATRFQVATDMLNCDYYAHAVRGDLYEHEAYNQYEFTDIPQTFIISILDNAIENNYFEPLSDTVFGFKTACTYAELLNIFYIKAGAPDVGVDSVLLDDGPSAATITGKFAPAFAWAMENRLIPDELLPKLDSFTPVTRGQTAVLFYRFVQLIGGDASIPAERRAQIILEAAETAPGMDPEMRDALAWCFFHGVMTSDGTLISAFEQAPNVMSRNYIMSAFYKYQRAVE